MRLATGLCLAMLACWPYVAYGQEEAEWTVMAWMNGDNNLEEYIVGDWKEMAWAGSGDAVNIVVQLDKRTRDDTHRFRIASRKDNDPVLRAEDKIAEANMVSGKQLAEFIEWARLKYPAKRYALIFSSHGTGWREFQVTDPATPPVVVESRSHPVAAPAVEEAPPEDRNDGDDAIPPPPQFLPEGVFGSPNRAVNSDDNSVGDALYNSEIAEALTKGMGGKPLDLIAFDACLMGMVEIAYGLRNAGRVLVSSEELVHSYGFDHSEWVGRMRADPAIDARAFAKMLVRSYDAVHQGRADPRRTLSAFDLGVAGELARAITTLSEALIADMDAQRPVIETVRAQHCQIYAFEGCDMGTRSCFFHVDLKQFAQKLAELTTSDEIRVAALRVGTVLQKGMIDNYAGPERRGGKYGSFGLAIYFPETPNYYLNDHLQQKAYFKANRSFPVEFVSQAAWADFLHVYHLGRREDPCSAE